MIRMFSNQEVLASTERGAGTGLTNYVNASGSEYAMLVIYITAKSGSPTLDVTMQCSPVDPAIDNTKWRTVYKEMQITNADMSSLPAIFGGHRQEDFSGWVRMYYSIGGTSTPKITFSTNIEIK